LAGRPTLRRPSDLPAVRVVALGGGLRQDRRSCAHARPGGVIGPVPWPRVFVGTLACGEAERVECSAAVAAQTGVSVTHAVLKGEPVRHLAPIGWHCRAPHPCQAFHFGLHRALKEQEAMIARCAAVWLVERDDARAWALAGAMSAGALRHHVDYGDAGFQAAF